MQDCFFTITMFKNKCKSYYSSSSNFDTVSYKRGLYSIPGKQQNATSFLCELDWCSIFYCVSGTKLTNKLCSKMNIIVKKINNSSNFGTGSTYCLLILYQWCCCFVDLQLFVEQGKSSRSAGYFCCCIIML